MSELTDLRKQLERLEQTHSEEGDLEKKLDEVVQRCVAQEKELLRVSKSSTSVTVAPTRDRKLRKYGGAVRGDFEQWEVDARGAMGGPGLSNQEQADFLFRHLEGSARREIVCCGDGVRVDPESILKALSTVFGGRGQATNILTEFWSRDQRVEEDGTPEESLASYSHALMEVLERLQRADPSEVSHPDHLLKKKFQAGVLDRNLRWELAQFCRENGTATFVEVREVALKWDQQSGNVKGAAKMQHTVQSSSMGVKHVFLCVVTLNMVI
jgi:hypothetical protein